MYAISTKPDLGNLFAESMSTGESVIFRGARISSVMRMTPTKYAAVTWLPFEGEVYAVTFYLNPTILKDFLELLPEQEQLEVRRTLSSKRGRLVRADFPGLDVTVTAQLGKAKMGMYERVTPFVVTHIQPGASSREPGSFESWDAGDPLPDFGTHLSHAKPDQEVYRFPLMGLTDVIYMGDGAFNALGYHEEGTKSYSVTFELDRVMLERLIENSMLREVPEARNVLLGPLEQYEAVSIVGVSVGFETRVGVRKDVKGVRFVPFIVTDVTEAERD